MTLDQLAGHMKAIRSAERSLRLARRLFSMGCVLVFLSAALLVFLLNHTPSGQILLFKAGLGMLVVGGPLVPAAWLGRRRLWATRNRLHRTLFAQGLRVDELGRVVTNEPHPRLVYDQTVALSGGGVG